MKHDLAADVQGVETLRDAEIAQGSATPKGSAVSKGKETAQGKEASKGGAASKGSAALQGEEALRGKEIPQRKKMIATVAIFIALAEVLFFNAMARTVGAYIPAELGNMDLYTLMNTVFFLCSTVVMPISCKLGDMYGRSRLILIGIAIYSVSMLAAGLSTDMLMHTVFRGGQGLGQGFMLANCLTALGELHEGAAKAKYLGFYGTVAGICNIFGPTLGGIIYQVLGWRAVFVATIVGGIIVVVLLLTQYPNVKKSDTTYLDVPGFVLMTIAAACAVLAFSWVSTRGWTDPLILGMLAVCVICAVGFVFVEKKSKSPIIPMYLFRNRYFTLCVIAACAIWPCMFSSATYFTLYAQAIHGMSATASGAVLSTQAIVNTIAGIVAGYLIAARKGRIKGIMIIIIALYAACMFTQSMCNADTAVLVLYIMMCVIGFGNGAAMGAFTTGVQNALPSKDISAGTATLQCFQSLTGTIGLSIMGLVLSSSFATKLASAIPQGLTDYVSQSDLSAYLTPAALINAQQTADFKATLPDAAQSLFDQMIQNVNTAYAESLQVVFIILTCLLAVALVAMVLLKEKQGQEEKVVVPDASGVGEVAA